MKTWIYLPLVFLLYVSTAVAGDNMKAFPPADPGMERYVLNLSEQTDESVFKVELIVGRTVEVDEQNRYFFGGQIQAENIAGWGFTRYIVRELGPMAGTMMAIDPNTPKMERFISLGGSPYLLRYNSRLPVVIYVPEGVEVRYRIWSAVEETMVVGKG
ncbi:ecotin [Desulfosediminicola flagellatus]|uniref:ecotin n=1 Tax=Desulfosediminicola flagellatus TaxID=2569541 RepID=UPI0010ABDDC4|nr:ecotin family protein [Desulfosediminicola flagellatus]